MKKEQVQRKQKSQINSVVISFRIWPHMSVWMRKENISPRAILILACKELGYKPENDFS